MSLMKRPATKTEAVKPATGVKRPIRVPLFNLLNDRKTRFNRRKAA